MSVAPFQIIDSIVNVAAAIIGILTTRLVFRQHLERFFSAKVYVAAVYIIFTINVIFEILKDFLISSSLMIFYIEEEITTLLLIAALLTSIAYVTYTRPIEVAFFKRVRTVLVQRFWPHGLAVSTISLYLIIIESYMLVVKPFAIVSIFTSGANVLAVKLSGSFLVLLFLVFVLFIAYPISLFMASGFRAKGTDEKRSIFVLAISWTAIGFAVILDSPLLIWVGLYGQTIVHLVLAGAILSAAIVFRRVTVFENLFDPSMKVTRSGNPFTQALGVPAAGILGKTLLLEIDPSASYEKIVKDFVSEELSNARVVFVFTYASSPALKLLSDFQDVRFYIGSNSVSYPRPTDEPHKVIIPEHHEAIVLDLMSRTVSTQAGSKPTIVFDNLTDWFISIGFEATVKMLGHMFEIVGSKDATCLFLMTSKAQDDKTMNYVRGRFQRILAYDSTGLRLVK